MAAKDHLCLLLFMLVVCENVFSKSLDNYPFRNISLPISERVKVLDQALVVSHYIAIAAKKKI